MNAFELAKAIYEWEESDENEMPTCVKCEGTFNVAPDLEPSPLCHLCAQAASQELAAFIMLPCEAPRDTIVVGASMATRFVVMAAATALQTAVPEDARRVLLREILDAARECRVPAWFPAFDAEQHERKR